MTRAKPANPRPGRPLKSKYRTPDGKFDRRAYNRDYLRNWRKRKAKGST